MAEGLGKQCSIAIVGGGIGGLTLANLLQKDGYKRVTVFEHHKHLKARGGHISIMSAALGGALPVLEALGLDDKLHAVAPITSAMKQISNGEVLGEYKVPLGPRIMREALQQILLDNLLPGTVRYGKTLRHFTEHYDSVELHFEDGTVDAFNLVVAADGINSTVAGQLHPDLGKHFTGFVYYACLAKGGAMPEGLFYDHHVHGRGKAFTVRAVSGGGFDGRWDGAYFAVRTDAPASSAWDAEGTREQVQPLLNLMQEHAGGCPAWLSEIVEKSERVWKWGIYEHPRKPSWISPGGRVVMMGDAAHAMSPFLGQGAQSAMQDALVLAAELARNQSLADALLAFELARKAPCEQVIQMANFEGLTATSFGIAAAYRNSLRNLVGSWSRWLSSLAPQWLGHRSSGCLLWLYMTGFHVLESYNKVVHNLNLRNTHA